jgi:hypothetical protein
MVGAAPKRAHDLDVVDQWQLRVLRRAGPCGFRRLSAELLAIRGASQAQTVESLLKLEHEGLVEREPGPGRMDPADLIAHEPRFRLTGPGKRVEGLVPETPRSPTIYYV